MGKGVAITKKPDFSRLGSLPSDFKWKTPDF